MTDINAVDLNLLKALDALIETRSVTRAAGRLGLSQPAVSGMLARLREVFGNPLFLRAQPPITRRRRLCCRCWPCCAARRPACGSPSSLSMPAPFPRSWKRVG